MTECELRVSSGCCSHPPTCVPVGCLCTYTEVLSAFKTQMVSPQTDAYQPVKFSSGCLKEKKMFSFSMQCVPRDHRFGVGEIPL